MQRRIRPIWEEWQTLERMLKKNDLLLLCDYDGTLAPIAPLPSLAMLPERTRSALEILSSKQHVTTGIVSGRPLREVRKLVGLKNVAYIGSHGYELCLPGRRTQTFLSPRQSRRLKTLAQELERLVKHLRGVWIERKSAAVAVHYRQTSPRAARCALELLRKFARNRKRAFRIQEGKMVYEFVPAGDVSKGTAVRQLVKLIPAHRATVRIYLGDDLTDESAYSKLRKRDFGILVGKRRPTAAGHLLRTPKDAVKFLRKLGEITR